MKTTIISRYSASAFSLRPAIFTPGAKHLKRNGSRSEEHTSELQSLMRISYAVFCLKKKNFVGYHRFHAPVALIADGIAYYFYPVKIQTALLIMEVHEFT